MYSCKNCGCPIDDDGRDRVYVVDAEGRTFCSKECADDYHGIRWVCTGVEGDPEDIDKDDDSWDIDWLS